jgi:hypothetical protein
MAAAIKALNAKIRSNKYTDYFCSTRTFYPDPVCASMGNKWMVRFGGGSSGRRWRASSRRRAIANTHIDFWGPASNFGIPIAAIADMSKDPEMYVLYHQPSLPGLDTSYCLHGISTNYKIPPFPLPFPHLTLLHTHTRTNTHPASPAA